MTSRPIPDGAGPSCAVQAILHRWPAIVSLTAAVIQLATGTDQDTVSIVTPRPSPSVPSALTRLRCQFGLSPGTALR